MKETYSMEGHEPVCLKRLPWMTYCLRCGLVYLNNDFTRWAIRMGCNNRDHPDYENARTRYTEKK